MGIISQSIGGRKLCAPTVTDFVHNVGANCVRPKDPDRQITVDNLGLLGQIALKSPLLEPDRNSPTRADVRNCLSKLTAVFAELQRQAKRENSPYNQENLPRLWILAPLVSETILNGFGAALDPNWPEGVYFLPPLQRTAIINRIRPRGAI